ncbi:MAG: mobile mystery protein A [Gemmatimonadaceae bacterium]|nr:mobile mystery protein A [Gemmatimonadaceae bacterium]
MTSDLRQLHLRQLDSVLDRYKGAREAPPRLGWIKEIRRALGMSTTQLARRLRVRQATVSGMEAREAAGTITLNSLRRAAEAMGCELVYAIVPRTTLREQLARRVHEVARERVSRVAHTMELESQSVSEEHLRQQLNELVEKLMSHPPRNLWD